MKTRAAKYSWLSEVFNSTATQPMEMVMDFKRKARHFLQYQKLHFPSERITPKEHLLGNHYWEFMRNFGCLGRYVEQALERIHQMPTVRGRRGGDLFRAQSQKRSWSTCSNVSDAHAKKKARIRGPKSQRAVGVKAKRASKKKDAVRAVRRAL